MKNSHDEKYWRIRIKDHAGADRSAEAWSRDEVGIWYGAWSHEDLALAIQKVREGSMKAHEYLNQVPAQERIGKWVTKSFVDTATRFQNISETDWIIVCFDGKLHFARVDGPARSNCTHAMNKPNGQGTELWKFKKIKDKKSFSLDALPDFYRLIPQAGRGNVFEFWGNNWEAIRILASSKNEKEVRDMFEDMSDLDCLNFLGPRAWESFCLGYLILEENFVPTGLAIGSTLKGLDIVGKNYKTGKKILAQCKKDSDQKDIDDGFMEAVGDLGDDARMFYFAYGGCPERHRTTSIEIIDRERMKSWVKKEVGLTYLKGFFSTRS